MKKLVPDWFTDNLHEIIYSDTTKSWLLVQGLEHTKELSSQDLRILRKHAQGCNNVEIAIRFHAKQSMVWKHISYMRQILGKRFMRDISKHPSVVNAMITFSRRHDAINANVNTVLHELAQLNPTEIGVLCCMVQKLSEHESLQRVNIMRRQYYDIKSKLKCIMKIPL